MKTIIRSILCTMIALPAIAQAATLNILEDRVYSYQSVYYQPTETSEGILVNSGYHTESNYTRLFYNGKLVSRTMVTDPVQNFLLSNGSNSSEGQYVINTDIWAPAYNTIQTNISTGYTYAGDLDAPTTMYGYHTLNLKVKPTGGNIPMSNIFAGVEHGAYDSVLFTITDETTGQTLVNINVTDHVEFADELTLLENHTYKIYSRIIARSYGSDGTAIYSFNLPLYTFPVFLPGPIWP